MKLCYPDIETVFSFDGRYINSLVIENQKLFLRIITDMYEQSEGKDGKAVLSKNNQPVIFSKNAEFINSFVPFNINTKSVLTKIQNILEKMAVSTENYVHTGEMLALNEKWILELSKSLPFDVEATKISVGNLLKSFGIVACDDSECLCEKLLNYMEIIRELDSDKLFIFVGLRSYLSEDEAKKFFDTVIRHSYCIFLIDAAEYELLPKEKRTVIDKQLCEF